MNIKHLLEDKNSQSIQSAPKKIYRKPRLFVYGELRDLTLGGSPGIGDSQLPPNTRVPAG